MIRTTPFLAVPLLAGCAATIPFQATLHPSARPDQDAGGIGLGAAYITSFDGGLAEADLGPGGGIFSIPYGEGFVRFGGNRGQTELRVTPGLGFLSYRADVTAPEAGTGVALVPSLGFGWTRMSAEGESVGQLTLAPGLSAVFLLANRSFYLSPRIGYAWANAVAFEESDTAKATMVGGTVGWLRAGDPFRTSFELSFARLASVESSGDEAIWMIVPSLGISR